MSKTRIHSTKSSIEATGIQRRLADHNINAMVIDKTDSAYGSAIGDIEVYVDEADLKAADEIVKRYFED